MTARRNNRRSRNTLNQATSGLAMRAPTIVQLNHADRQAFLESSRLAERSAEPSTADVILQRPRRDKPINVIQSASATVTGSVSVDTASSIITALTSSADAASWAAVFDSYRIMGVKVKWIPLNSQQQGVVHTVLDYDDGNAPASESAMLQYDTLKSAPANVYFEREFIPRIAMAAYSGSFTSYAQSKPFQWIDVASPSVAHYGLKYYIPATSSASTPSSWKVVIDVHFQFKNAR